MRSTDEQLREILKRAEHIKEKQAARRTTAFYALSACACLALLVVTAGYLPSVSGIGGAQGPVRYGSLLLSAPYMGYVLVCVLAFALGVSVTLLGLQLRRARQKERERK